MRWSEEEKADLIELAKSVPFRAICRMHIANHPHRTWSGVRDKLRRLGITYKKSNSNGDFFSVPQLAELFNRDRDAITDWLDAGILKKTKRRKYSHRFISYENVQQMCLKRPDLARLLSVEWYEFFVGKPKPKIWDTRELANALFVSRATIRFWRLKKWIQPVYAKDRHCILFDTNSLKGFLEAKPELRENYEPLINKLLREG